MTNKAEIRMRGFLRRTPVSDLVSLIRENCQMLDQENVPLEKLGGRVLANGISSPENVPGFNRSAMDGYALKAEETFGATSYSPIEFKILGEVIPGTSFKGKIEAGETVRIMTGSPVPEGASAILVAEHAEEEKGKIKVLESVPPGKHIGLIGEDVSKGDQLFNSGRRLRPQDLGVLASTGFNQVSVICQPVVDLLITGNEILKPGQVPSNVSIVDANSLMIKQLAERDGAVINSIIHLKDDRELIKKALMDSKADLICVTGGTSVGVEDHAPTLLEEIGTLLVHGIPLRPATPTAFGLLGKTKVFLLPGNPVSCLSAYDCFMGMGLRLMGGLPEQWPYRSFRLHLAEKIASQVGRIEYVCLFIEKGRAIPIASGGASILSSTTQADAFLLTEESSEGFAAGTEVEVWLYE